MDRKKFMCHLKLAFCVLSMAYVQILIGCTYSYNSNFLEELRQLNTTLKFTVEQESWITSIPVLVCPFGLPVIGMLMDKFGRRIALQVIYIPMIVSWAIIVNFHSYTWFLIARLILGITFGSSSCLLVYVAEVCPTNLRPIYGSTVTLFVGTGMLVECVLSINFPWITVAKILFVASVVGFVPLCLVKESPMWLESRGRKDQAREVTEWFDVLRITDPEVRTSATGASAAVTAVHDDDNDDDCRLHSDFDDEEAGKDVGDRGGKDVGNCDKMESLSYWRLYADRTVWMPTMVLGLIFTCQQFGGVYVLLFYASDVVRDFNFSTYNRIIVNVYLSIARILGSLTFLAMHRVMYRKLLTASGAGMAVSLCVVVGYLKVFGLGGPYSEILVIGFLFYMYFALLGMMTIPWIVCGEVFPIAVRGTMSGVMNTWGYALWFVMVKIYPSLVSNYGMKIVWATFAFFCSMAALSTQLFLPETKGRSLDEILSYFRPREKNKRNRVP